jgi:hypothetical protein
VISIVTSCGGIWRTVCTETIPHSWLTERRNFICHRNHCRHSEWSTFSISYKRSCLLIVNSFKSYIFHWQIRVTILQTVLC